MNIQEIISRSRNLPASEIVEAVNENLGKNNTPVITAPPGAGKSTLLPLSIPDNNGKILMLEPRRLAARQIAERMADTINELTFPLA